MAATETRAWFRRMREQAGVLGFRSDFATLTASSQRTNFEASYLKRFIGCGAGRVWRSTGDTAESLLWDFGSAVDLNWIYVDGAGAKGLRDAGAAEAVLTLKADNSPEPSTEIGTLVYSPITGGWSLDFDTVTARYAQLFIDRPSGSPAWDYVQLARVALDAATPFPGNYSYDFAEDTEELTTLYAMEGGGEIPRFRRPRLVLTMPFPQVGAEDDDLEVWQQFRGYAGERESANAPQIPLYLSPDPTGQLAGTEGHFAPRFCYARKGPAFASAAVHGRVYSSSLQLVQTGR